MSTVRVTCKYPYHSGAGDFQPGVHVMDSSLAEWLMRDSPGCFEYYKPKVEEAKAEAKVEAKAKVEAEVKDVDAPPEDKAVKPTRVSRKGK